jgi:hypothetical protein
VNTTSRVGYTQNTLPDKVLCAREASKAQVWNSRFATGMDVQYYMHGLQVTSIAGMLCRNAKRCKKGTANSHCCLHHCSLVKLVQQVFGPVGNQQLLLSVQCKGQGI